MIYISILVFSWLKLLVIVFSGWIEISVPDRLSSLSKDHFSIVDFLLHIKPLPHGCKILFQDARNHISLFPIPLSVGKEDFGVLICVVLLDDSLVDGHGFDQVLIDEGGDDTPETLAVVQVPVFHFTLQLEGLEQ